MTTGEPGWPLDGETDSTTGLLNSCPQDKMTNPRPTISHMHGDSVRHLNFNILLLVVECLSRREKKLKSKINHIILVVLFH